VTSRAKLAAFGTVVAAAVGAQAAGCRQVVGIEASPQFEGQTVSCGVTFAGDGCDACMKSSCCDEADTCAGAAHCGDFAGCVGACAGGDLACASACRARFGASYGAEAAALEGCKAARCGAACGATCGGFVYPTADCGSCTNAHCCDLATACAGGAECSALVACEHACGVADDVCLQRCELAHPTGVAAARALGQCAADNCAASCIHPRWACLQHPAAPPAPVGGAIGITYRVSDYAAGKPGAGLQVRLCAIPDLGCVSGLPGVLTASDGSALVRPFDNHYEGFAEISGAGYATQLVYLPRLTKSFVTPVLGVATPDLFAMTAGNVVNPIEGAGNLFVYVRDCFGAPADGVKFSIEPAGASTPFYFADNLPSANAKATDKLLAVGGFINVIASTAITIHATVAENGLTYPPVIAQARPDTKGWATAVLYAVPQ